MCSCSTKESVRLVIGKQRQVKRQQRRPQGLRVIKTRATYYKHIGYYLHDLSIAI